MVAKYSFKIGGGRSLPETVKLWKHHGSQDIEVINACNNLLKSIKHRSRIKYILGYRDDEVIAVFPVRILKDGSCHIAGSLERLDYVDFLYSKAAEKDIENLLKQFFSHLKKHYAVKRFTTRFVDPNSKTYKTLKTFKGFKLDEKVKNVKTELKSSYEEYFTGLTKHSKQNIRTAYNRIEKSGKKYDFIVYRGAHNNLDKNGKRDVKECLNLYIKRQNNKYEHNDPLYRIKANFANYISVSARTDENMFTAILKIDGKISAFFEGFYCKDYKSIEIPKLAINIEDKFFSPGMVLLAETIKYLEKDKNIKYLDLCRGTEGYKYAIGGKDYDTINFTLKI